jgi:hypothetical protein
VVNVFYLEACITASIKLPAADKGPGGSQDGEPKKVILNSADALFAELRDKNFNAVGSIVSKKAKHITAEFDVSIKIKMKISCVSGPEDHMQS